jgi:hypothetical protein
MVSGPAHANACLSLDRDLENYVAVTILDTLDGVGYKVTGKSL